MKDESKKEKKKKVFFLGDAFRDNCVSIKQKKSFPEMHFTLVVGWLGPSAKSRGPNFTRVLYGAIFCLYAI